MPEGPRRNSGVPSDSFLWQDSAPGGPEVRADVDAWVEARLVPASLVIRVGEPLARQTNHGWWFRQHCVTNPAHFAQVRTGDSILSRFRASMELTDAT
jgi:hypothetical protein